ncbi:MAG: hypothetical protein ACD_62C00672G0003 [uncultured bacterium]|nr:MAG: hypothetical protein ACD_62C00672G0003 [uncultured bacterium]HLD44569.1 hypothetical protein [bacterium]
MTKKRIISLAFILYLALAIVNWLWWGGVPIVYALLNFSLFCTLLILGTKDRVTTFFCERSDVLSHTMTTAQKTFENASRSFSEAQNNLKLLSEQKQAILDTVVFSAKKEALLMSEETQQLRAQLLSDAKQRAHQEEQKTKRRLKMKTINEATLLARQKIIQTLTKKDHEQLGREFLIRIRQETLL